MNDLTYYGGFRTQTFTEIFKNYQVFQAAWGVTPLGTPELTDDDIKRIYMLLYSRYANSHIASRDVTQFNYHLMSLIWQYGPTWKKKLEIQQSLRGMSEEEMIKGGKAIYNHSYNPSTAPSTSTMEELLTINDQNTTNYKKSKLEGYSILLSLLEADVTEEFISKFKKLFLVLVAPDYPLLYETEV